MFLGAYINQVNAQNINCRLLAGAIDKSKFEIYTLRIKHGNLKAQPPENIKTFTCRYPVKLTGRIGYLWGIIQADVVYLPRADFLKWQMFLIKLFKRKSLKTIENIIDDMALNTALVVPKRKLRNVLDYYKYCDQNHPITNYVGRYNKEHHNLDYDLPVLPVPNDVAFFASRYRIRLELKSLVFIGNDFLRKGLSDFVELANHFPALKFFIIGRDNFELYKEKVQHNNITFLGALSHLEMLETLDTIDVHFFPSKSEGFGKVTIECAALGIPSIVYDSYGAKEWINESEGMVVSSFSDAIECIKLLLSEPKELARYSSQAKKLADRFSTENVVPIYEGVLQKIYES